LPTGIEVVAMGLSSPVHLTAPPDDVERVFIVERPGRIRVVRNGTLLGAPFLDLTGVVLSGGEQGLLSLAFHPDYATNGHFFVNYTDLDGHTRVERYTVTAAPDVADPASDLTILSVEQPFSNHNGGQVAFGPDGMLYIGMGDGGGEGGDPLRHGQNRATLLGSLLRIDVDAASPYAIPPDNPFVADPSAAPETWAYGLRNPWRFSFDRHTGDLYIGDVGQDSREEISFQPAASPGGENYGWKVMEGTACFSPRNGCSQAGLVPPVLDYTHADGCSVTGGFVYRGVEPTLAGRYFFADVCQTWERS
jgi:glucose/arabinose dehydrogenase